MTRKRVLACLLSLCVFCTSGNFAAAANDVSGGDSSIAAVQEDTVSGNDSVSDNDQEEPESEEPEGEETVSGGNEDDLPVDETPDSNAVSDGDLVISEETVTSNDVLLGEQESVPYTITDGVLVSWDSASGAIVIPGEVTAIGEAVFMNNAQITSVTIPEGVTEIRKDAFKNCEELKNVTYPKSLTTIGESAFERCEKLFMLYTSDEDYTSLNEIGAAAFKSCKALKYFASSNSFHLSDTITTMGNEAFSGCAAITSVTLPDKLVTMGTSVFMGCTYLMDITFSQYITTVPEGSFKNCNSLNHIEWKNVKIISNSAFWGCSDLRYVEIPSWMLEIHSNAFAACSKLTDMVIHNKSIELETDIFSERHGVTLYGHKNSMAHIYASNYDPFIKFVDFTTDAGADYPIKKTIDSTASVFVYTMAMENGVEKKVERTTATKNTKLYLEIGAPSGYVLREGTLRANGVVLTAEKGIYSFTQSIGGTTLTAEFDKSVTEAIPGLSGTTSEELINGQMKVGQTSQIYLFSTDTRLESPLRANRFTFTSSSATVASVSAGGLITALKEGNAIITAKDKNSSASVTFAIKVVKSPIENINLKLEFDTNKAALTEEESWQILTLNEKSVLLEQMKVSVKAIGYDGDGEKLNTKYKWTSSDTKVAKLSSATTASGKATNTITIPAKTAGEAVITVEAQDGSGVKRYISIRVADTKPSLLVETATFNANLEQPMVVSLIESYGEAVTKVGIYTESKEGEEGETDGTLFKITSIGNQKYVISEQTEGTVRDGKYQVYLSGNTAKTPFSHKLTITVKNTIPAAKVKFTGKINLFNAKDGEAQTVATTISNIGSAKIESYSLEALGGTDAQKEDYNKFTDNFEIDETTGVISRKAKTLGIYENSTKKPVTKGYLVLHFDGYKESAVKKLTITVPTAVTAPKLSLSATSGSFNKQSTQSEARVQLIDKSSKTPRTVNLVEEGYQVQYDMGKSNDCFTFEGSAQIDDKTNEILMPFQTPSKNAKAVLRLYNPEKWGDSYIALSYTAKVTSALPKISLSKTKTTFNALYLDQKDTFTLKSNQKDTRINDNQVFVADTKGNAAKLENIAKLEVLYEDGLGTVRIKEGETVAAGSYKFYCVPTTEDYYMKGGEPTNELNKLTLTVTVTAAVPTIKLKSTSFSLNYRTRGTEEAVRTYTVSNASLLSGYQIDNDNTIIEYTGKVAGVEEVMEFHFTDTALGIKLTDSFNYPEGKYKFNITPAFAKSDHVVMGKKLSVTVTVGYNEVVVNFGTAKGKIDLLNRDGDRAKAAVSYKVTVKNVNDTIKKVKLYDYDVENNVLITDSESDKFKAEMDNGYLVIRAIDGAEIKSNTTYTLRIYYELEYSKSGYDVPGVGTGGFWIEKYIKVKPTQNFPKVTVSPAKVNLYASNKDYVASFTLTPKKGATAAISGVTWAKDVDDKMKDTFEIIEISEPDALTGAVRVTIKLSPIVRYSMGSSQKIKFAVTCDGQDPDTYGTTFTVTAKINR